MQAGLLPKERVLELGELPGSAEWAAVCKAGGRTDAGITVFDSTGVAVQDVAIADMAFTLLSAAAGPPQAKL